MKKLICLSLCLILFLTACAPTEQAIQTAIAKTQEAAPSATATLTRTPLPTATQTATVTSTPTITPTPTLLSILGQPGWKDYAGEGFYLALPPEWVVMDVKPEDLAALLQLFAGGEDPALQRMLTMFTTGVTVDVSSMGGFGGMGDLGSMFGGMGDLGNLGDLGGMLGDFGGDMGGFGDLMGGMGGMFGPTSFTMKPEMKFFAMDAGREVKGHPVAMVMKMVLPMPVGSSMLCSFMPNYFSQMGMTIVDSLCGLKHNGLDGGFFEAKAVFGGKDFHQHMYFLLSGSDMFMLQMSVEEEFWTGYEPLFGFIAQSFSIGEPPPGVLALETGTPAAASPTSTSTAGPSPTGSSSTAAGGSTPTPTPPPLAGRESWKEYTPTGYRVSLPPAWQAVDVDKQGMDELKKTVEELDDAVAKFVLEMMDEMSTGGMGGMGVTPQVRFFARDAGTGVTDHAMLNIMSMSLPVALGSNILCSMMPAAISQMGFEVVDKQCGLSHAGMDGGRFEMLGKVGETDFRQHMYFYLKGKDLWIVTLGVEDAAWQGYLPVFDGIADSFNVGP